MLVVHAADRSKASLARLIKLTDLVLVYRQLSAPVVPGADHTIDKQRLWRDEMSLYGFCCALVQLTGNFVVFILTIQL